MNYQKVLLTGAAGSVGQLLTNYFIEQGSQVFALDRNEIGLLEMSVQYPSDQFIPIPIPYQNFDMLRDFFDKTDLDLVIHAAAVKITRFCEQFTNYYEKNNVTDAYKFLQYCFSLNIKRVILLSSDEAFFPHNHFGKQKETLENLLIHDFPEFQNRIIHILRFPFLLESQGSVWNVFRKQARQNLPLTVADKDSTKLAASYQEFICAWDQFISSELPSGNYRFNIGNKINIYQLAQEIKEEFHSKSPITITGVSSGNLIKEPELPYDTLEPVTELIQKILSD